MNREQMIAWLTLEGWAPSCSIGDDPFNFFIKRRPPELVRIAVYGKPLAVGQGRVYKTFGPYAPMSDVATTETEWEDLSDAQVARAYEEACQYV